MTVRANTIAGVAAAMFAVLGASAVGAAAPATQPSAAAPASQPASAPAGGIKEWGAAKAGLQVGLACEAAPAVGAEFDLRLALRNSGTSPVKLPPAAKVVGWFLVGQQAGEDKKFYTQRYYLAVGTDNWPAELAPGAAAPFPPVAIGESTVYSSKHAKALLSAYVSGKIGADLPPSEGRLSDVIVPGSAAVRLTLLLAGEDGRTEGLNSNTIEVQVSHRPLAGMTPEARKAFVAEILQQFDKDAWSASKAHDRCVTLGRDVVADLIPAAKDRKRPDYARMWLATALADIRDERAADALVDLLDDPQAGVRSVVAYHGPKQKSDRLDAAVVRKVEKARDTSLTAYAVLGFTVFRGTAPEALLKRSLESEDPKVRAAVASALKNHASDFNVQRLQGLLSDADEKIRASAARMLQQLTRRGRGNTAIYRAMVAALDLPGETARQRICQVLTEMSGNPWPYDPAADEAARQKVLAAWRDWIQKAPQRED